jgi:hypothetical protein
LEYIGSRVPLHKSSGGLVKQNKKAINYSPDEKPKKVIKKPVIHSSDDSDEKPKKVIKRILKKPDKQ